MKKTMNFAWMMAASLMIVIVLTLILCLAELGTVVSTVIAAADAAAAIMFALCPTLAERAEHKESENKQSLRLHTV